MPRRAGRSHALHPGRDGLSKSEPVLRQRVLGRRLVGRILAHVDSYYTTCESRIAPFVIWVVHRLGRDEHRRGGESELAQRLAKVRL